MLDSPYASARVYNEITSCENIPAMYYQIFAYLTRIVVNHRGYMNLPALIPKLELYRTAMSRYSKS